MQSNIESILNDARFDYLFIICSRVASSTHYDVVFYRREILDRTNDEGHIYFSGHTKGLRDFLLSVLSQTDSRGVAEISSKMVRLIL